MLFCTKMLARSPKSMIMTGMEQPPISAEMTPRKTRKRSLGLAKRN